MVDIVFKRRKENSKSRRMRERGEHYAMYKAQCDSDRMMARRIDAAFTKLSEGCSNKILTAVTQAPDWRCKPSDEPEFINMENPQHRKVLNEAGRVINARQKQRGKSIPLI